MAALKEQHGIAQKVIATQNPQSNSVIEGIHQVAGNMMRTGVARGSKDLDEDFGWHTVSAAIRHAVKSMVHTTNCATPTQLVFNRDAMLNASFKADWQCIKQHRVLQNNKAENAEKCLILLG